MSATAVLSARLSGHAGPLQLAAAVDTGAGTLVLIGPNGAGKTSFLQMLLGARTPDDGRITVGDTVLLDSAASIVLPLEKRRLGYLPQDYALFPHLDVRGNLAFAVASSQPHLSRKLRAEQVELELERLDLTAHARRAVQSLSGGEKQRVALARALSARPRALLLDEPLAALDVHSRHEVRASLACYLQQLHLPCIVVTHDAADVRELADCVVVLEAGKVTQRGAWEELCRRPASSFVQQFVTSADWVPMR